MGNHALLLFMAWPLVSGVKLSPCGNDGVSEIVANQENQFICTAQRQWVLRLNDSEKPVILALFKGDWKQTNDFGGIFAARTTGTDHTSMMIKPVNNTELYEHIQIVNGSLECHGSDNKSDRCGLNFVYPPEGVVCTASNTSWSVHVSCVIDSVYSSRRIYECQLIRYSNTVRNESLDNVTMMTSPTSERIAENEVKVSGVCQFNTTLPAEDGNYGYIVSISPGHRPATAGKMWYTVERPPLPTISCSPRPYVRENANVTCICHTTHIGQPEGSLKWVTGNLTNKERSVWDNQQTFTPQGLLYRQSLALSDHNNTWFRCDVVWGTENITGEKYTANVGYAAKTPQLFVSGRDRNRRVMEGDSVQLLCESDGRPSPNVTISNSNNGTVIWRDVSPSNYTFIGRCEDTGTYTCSARNEFSSRSGETTSSSHVECKPRSDSGVTHLGNVTFGNKSKELNFDVIANPTPSELAVWLERPADNDETSCEKVENSEINVTCKANAEKRYLSRCTLTVLRIPSLSTAWYKVQVINEHGHENFTVVISYASGDQEAELPENHLVATGSVGAVVLVTATAALIVAIRKRKRDSSKHPQTSTANSARHNNRRNNEDEQEVQGAEVIYNIPWDSIPVQGLAVKVTPSTSQLGPCRTPIYAVVDKLRKKTNRNEGSVSSAAVSDSEFQPDSEQLYAVVDKARGRTPAKCSKYQTAEKDQKTRKDQWMKATEDNSRCNDNSPLYENYQRLPMSQLQSQNQVSGLGKGSSPASRLHGTDDGRWENDDGLIYTLPVFDVTNDARRPPPSGSQETEYCTLREIEQKFPALDKY